MTAASTALPPWRSTSRPAFVASGDADTTMAESAVATLARRVARARVAAGALRASPDPVSDGRQPETMARTATASAFG